MLHHITAARALYARTLKEKFALGAFNVDNQETLKAIVEAAAAKQSPALVEVSHGEVEAIGLHNMRCLVDNYRQEYGVELYINLDHAPSVEAAKAGIDAGFEFIHIDFSQQHHDAKTQEIIDATKEVVAYAKKTGALVESEPHYFGGGSNVFETAMNYDEVRKTFTKPAEAKAFIEDTGIDTFAVAIGNLHGLYPVPKQLDVDLLQEIRAAVPGYLSLHGGSGTPDDQFRAAVQQGVSKININSELRKAFRLTLEHELATHKNEYAIVKLMPAVVSAVRAVVEHKMDVFGSAGKAGTTSGT